MPFSTIKAAVDFFTCFPRLCCPPFFVIIAGVFLLFVCIVVSYLEHIGLP